MHIHVYRVIEMYEIDLEDTVHPAPALQKAIELVENGCVEPSDPDNEFVAVSFEEEDEEPACDS